MYIHAAGKYYDVLKVFGNEYKNCLFLVIRYRNAMHRMNTVKALIFSRYNRGLGIYYTTYHNKIIY